MSNFLTFGSLLLYQLTFVNQRISIFTNEFLIKLACRILTALYCRIFWNFVVRPIEDIIDEATTVTTVRRTIRRWLHQRRRETQYVQLAGGFVVAGVTAMLSWPEISSRHWLAPASLYSSIILSLAAVIFASQQAMLIDRIIQTDDRSTAVQRDDQYFCFKADYWRKQRSSDTENPWAIRWSVLLAWQAPIMCLTYSLLLLFIGMTTHVVAPVARDTSWNADGKTMVFYLTFCAMFTISFLSVGPILHHSVEA
ncbi:hypothetical protein K469DRAFT_718777 [Zopfia rhizophila CBS 207.26]|uniref:Uncharacterized protein n=1 Tax=Zopfia rhizophila CBS 207.26 TaxID=1314779 RepID=A0A6A6EKT9_9PEZI|nr:hypothetical protein K469DRAFT_718777 [Zopfia rhizophila CBS 207.26]